MPLYLVILTVLAAVGSGLMAGTFFAFSVFVMGALGRLPGDHGIAAMKSINVVVLNPLFLGVFVGTALVCGVLGIVACATLTSPGRGWLLAGCLLYVVGCFGLTMAFNVPLNDQLARTTEGTAEAASLWVAYQARWTAWNHVRAIAPLMALVGFMLALRAGSAP